MSRISRRRFAKHAFVMAGAAAVLPDVLAQNPPAVDPANAAAPALSPASAAEAEARIRWVIDKHGARLSETERADIRRLITGAQPGLDAMRAWPIDNSVEPATQFQVWRRDRDGSTAKRNLRPIMHSRGEKS
jgi:hypothetical protein